MQCVFAPEGLHRPILGMIVQKRTDASHLVFDARPAHPRAAIVIVLAAHLKANAIPRRHDDTGRPDLDVGLDWLSGKEMKIRFVTPARSNMGVSQDNRGFRSEKADGRGCSYNRRKR